MGRGQEAVLRPQVVLFAVLALLCALSAAGSEAPKQVTSLAEELSLARPFYRPTELASCSLKNHVPTAMAFFSGIEPDDRFASFMNPANCAGTTDYPYSIYFVSFPLFHFAGVHWPVGINLEIWSVAGGDSCAGPQTLLYAHHFLLDSTSFKAPRVGVLKLPDPVCVSGPFFVSVHYDGSTPGPYPSVLFDTLVPPQACLNWGYRSTWTEWNDFWTGPFAGNFMVWVDGYSSSNYCQTDETTTLTIESTHDQHDTLQGSRVSLVGYYTGQNDGKFVSRYTDYLRNEPLPPKSEMIVIGPQPGDSFAGAYSELTGYVQVARDPRRISPTDTVTLRILPSKLTKILPGPAVASSAPAGTSAQRSTVPHAACDSCKFALIFAGGPNEANNHTRFWEDLRSVYEYQTTFGGYCPSSVYALYYDGTSRDVVAVPQERIDSCTPGRITSQLNEISHRVALCFRKNSAPSLEVLSAAGGRAAGPITLRDSALTSQHIRTMLQKTLDSGLQTLRIDMSQSFGGPLADSLKVLNDLKRTGITVYSAAGDGQAWSPADGSRFLKSQLAELTAGASHDVAVARGADAYLNWLDSLHIDLQSWSTQIRTWLQTHPPVAGDSARPKLVQDSLGLRQTISEIASTLVAAESRPVLWARRQLKKFCEWQSITTPPGGQFNMEVTGDTSTSGSITVYKDTVIGGNASKIKSAVWHWNIPGSAGYSIGNNVRILNGNNSGATTFWIHNDNLEAAVTATLRTQQPDVPTASNPYAFPGFSLGGTDNSSAEFRSIFAPSLTLPDADLPGCKLSDLPAQWGACGVPQLTVQYTVPVLTPWHTATELRVEVAQVITPGTITFQIPGAQNSSGSFTVNSPGTYKFDCGAFTQTGPNQVSLSTTSGCFTIDSWALRSSKLDPASCCVGTTGNVNGAGIVDLADLSMLVAYLLTGGTALPCPAEANVNATGIIDLSDLSRLIAYLIGTPTTLPSCP